MCSNIPCENLATLKRNCFLFNMHLLAVCDLLEDKDSLLLTQCCILRIEKLPGTGNKVNICKINEEVGK